ncbi:hypothetical protein E2C01_073558 [Portunus trituberculatus]|uniref:Uncharacterized protein n=1 Tax=Portunus trituberculatus TaxID=210409 RepID=A0A5B7IAW8_PORTR|nr:hypothetical protein [Portunus trituberculatus]
MVEVKVRRVSECVPQSDSQPALDDRTENDLPSQRRRVFTIAPRSRVSTVLEAERQDFYIANCRNTLENPTNHLCGPYK